MSPRRAAEPSTPPVEALPITERAEPTDHSSSASSPGADLSLSRAVAPPPALSLSEMPADAFQALLSEEGRKTAALNAYIRANLTEDVDFGKIKMGNGRVSKPSLFKPGAEKICRLLHLKPSFQRDAEILDMLGEEARGWICLVCRLTTPSGEIVAEGRGAAGPKQADLNARIKMAQKSAQIDATLRAAALSGHFTQDLEDMPRETVEAQAPPPPQDPRAKELAALFALADERGISHDAISAQFLTARKKRLSEAFPDEIRTFRKALASAPLEPPVLPDEPKLGPHRAEAPLTAEEEEALNADMEARGAVEEAAPDSPEGIEKSIKQIRTATTTYSMDRIESLLRLFCSLKGQNEARWQEAFKHCLTTLKLDPAKGWNPLTAPDRARVEEKILKWVRDQKIPF